MLEELIKQLDNRGLLILQIMLGQRAMELLEVPKGTVLQSENTSPQVKPTLLHV